MRSPPASRCSPKIRQLDPTTRARFPRQHFPETLVALQPVRSTRSQARPGTSGIAAPPDPSRLAASGCFINLDMEQFSFKRPHPAIFKTVFREEEFRDWPDVGIAMQAYLRSTVGRSWVSRRLAARRGTPVWVRLVKGAYRDYETIVAAQNGWPVSRLHGEIRHRCQLRPLPVSD